MPACPFYQLIRFPPSVGLSINKFQPTLTVVKYSPTWHLVGDSQSLGMLQTAPLSLREGREEIQAWGAPFPWRSVFSPQHPRLARALECPPGEDSHHTCFHLLEPRWVLKWGNQHIGWEELLMEEFQDPSSLLQPCPACCLLPF